MQQNKKRTEEKFFYSKNFIRKLKYCLKKKMEFNTLGFNEGHVIFW